MAAGLIDAFRIIEQASPREAEVIVLTDAQRLPWEPDNSSRWDLVRELRQRLTKPPDIRVLHFDATIETGLPDGALGPVILPRSLASVGQPFAVSTTLFNAGTEPLTRQIELLIDGRVLPGTSRFVGPVPPGGQVQVSFSASLALPGSHEIRARLTDGNDANPADNEAADVITIVDRLRVLLVEGAPSTEPLRGSADFLHAALTLVTQSHGSIGVPAESFFEVTKVPHDQLSTAMISSAQVVILSNVDSLGSAITRDLNHQVASGCGLMVVLGDRSNPDFLTQQEWFPGIPGDFRSRSPGKVDATLTRPAPQSFTGPIMGRFALGTSANQPPALAGASVLGYRLVEPSVPGRTEGIVARLETGDPWLIDAELRERTYTRGDHTAASLFRNRCRQSRLRSPGP